MAGPAAPSSNRHGPLLILNDLAAGAQHRTITGWTMHDVLLHGRQVVGQQNAEKVRPAPRKT